MDTVHRANKDNKNVSKYITFTIMRALFKCNNLVFLQLLCAICILSIFTVFQIYQKGLLVGPFWYI